MPHKNFCLAHLVYSDVDKDIKAIELLSFNAVHFLQSEVHFPHRPEEKLQLSGCNIVNPELQKSITTGSIEMTQLLVYMLDTDERKLATYNVSARDILSTNVQHNGVMNIVLAATHFDPDLEYADFLQTTWCKNRQKKNRWADLDFPHRRAWLNLVRTHHCFHRIDIEDKPANMVYELDGRFVSDYSSFFIALGEAINGPGGYFGGGFDALADCLCGGFGATAPFTLIWKSSTIARIALDKNKQIEEALAKREYALRNGDNEEHELPSIAEIMEQDYQPFFDKVVEFLATWEGVELILEE